MAEVFVKGVDGRVNISAKTQSRVTNWTMTMTAPVEDVTNFSADGQQNEYTGHAYFTGSLSGQTLRSDSATTQEMQAVMETFANGGTLAAVQLKLIESTKAMYWGNVLITNIGKDAGAQGLQTYSADWVPSTGRLKFATSTST